MATPLIIPDTTWRWKNGQLLCPRTTNGGNERADEFFLHQTVQVNKAWTKAQERQAMRDLWNFHVHTRGWSDIGYHYIQFPSGRIYRARPTRAVPAAQEGHNTGTRALALVGTNPILSVLQRRKLRRLIRTLRDEQGFHTLGGHREVTQTECPGDRVYAWVRKWRLDFKLRRPVA